MHPFFALKKTPLLLFPFRFFDPIRKRWVRARYVAERHQIEARYPQFRSSAYASAAARFKSSTSARINVSFASSSGARSTADG